MKPLLSFFILLSLGAAAHAAEIRRGSIMTVTAMSMWFEEAIQLEQWQQMKKAGDARAFDAYQEKVLGAREAWQFINPLKVKIIGYNPKKSRVYVEMTGKGRLEGAEWFVDAAAIAR